MGAASDRFQESGRGAKDGLQVEGVGDGLSLIFEKSFM